MNRDTLMAKIAGGNPPKWCYFWGHTPSTDGSVTKACFSQWWAGHPFVIGGVTYVTAEHWMMAQKARLFEDQETCDRILGTSHPNAAKKLGREVRGFDENRWREARFAIVVEGNLAKFGQHAPLSHFLIATGDRVLVEASPYDRIWGIGLGASHPDAGNPSRWRGENLLGFALMIVREKLRSRNSE